ncbi:MAG TPA: SAM-dependent methyltransferase, partial [Streptomyces sp.]|nr:SAM-dependent methyltransferase [Streptomyces sp.]
FIRDEEGPLEIVRALTSRLPEGSCLILSHITADFDGGAALEQVAQVYKGSTAQLVMRSRDELMPFYDGFQFLEPGLVRPPLWRPDGPVPEGEDLLMHHGYAGVAVKGGV